MSEFASAFDVAGDHPPRWNLRRSLLAHFCARMVCGSLTIVLPGGSRFVHKSGLPGPDGVLVIHRWRILRRLLLRGDLGFAESYIDGDWSSPNLTTLLEMATLNERTLGPAVGGTAPTRFLRRLLHRARANTLRGSRRNIEQHYDLGNDFYSAWLDTGMAYSSAFYRDPDMTLEMAQAAKFERVAELLAFEPNQTVLEIGCGWGGMAEKLGLDGCHVTGITLSPAQLRYSQERLANAGLAQLTDLRLQDYRELEGRFDRIVSIEMLEAVGEAYWPAYFAVLRDRLKPGGAAVLQVITIANERFEEYRRKPDFIQRHIFPGGMLPSATALRSAIAQAGLTLDQVETFGESYALTLCEWRCRFHGAWSTISAMGFSERFRRMWDYYLSYCEAGFRAGAVDVGLWRIAG